MLLWINAAVIFAFGLVISGIVFLGGVQMREQAMRESKVKAARKSRDQSPSGTMSAVSDVRN